MKKQLADPYKGLGEPVSIEEYNKRKIQRQMYKELGLLPYGYCSRDNYKVVPQDNNNRFSKYYEDEQSF